MNTFENIQLTKSYKNASYKSMLGNHLTSVLDLVLGDSNEIQTSDKSFKFSNGLYWECIEQIYEKNFDKISEELEEKLIIQKASLYEMIISKLGTFYEENDLLLMKSIDFTVSNYFDNILFKNILSEENPWSYCDKIFTEKHLLYSFSDNRDEYNSISRNKSKESELSKDLTIGVLRKGFRSDYGVGYIKDNFALRKLFLDILDEDNYDSNNPIKLNEIYKLFRSTLEISEEDLPDNGIRNWILKPLKSITKIGSSKEGYFIIRNEDDLYMSYRSHYQNYLGFYETLEKHRKYSEKLNTSYADRFNKHIKE
jgi:hypothetical protein